MAYSYVDNARSTNNGQTSAATVASFVVPLTAQVGDTMIVGVVVNSGVATLGAPSTAWRALRPVEDALNSNMLTQIWVKDVTDAAEIGSTVTFTRLDGVGGRIIGGMQVLRGVSAATIVASAPATTATAGTAHTAPTLTTTVTDSGLVNFWFLRVATAAPAPDLDVSASQTEDNTVKTAFTASPNYTIQLSHRTTPTGTPASYGGATATSSAAATAIVYTIIAPPKDNGGGGGTLPASASFTASVQVGYAPLAVTFTNTSTGTPTAYLWDFGDGSATSTATSPSHTYQSAGSYTVTLTASNATGSSSAQLSVQVSTLPTAGGLQWYINIPTRGWVALTWYLNVPGDTPDPPPPTGTWDRSAPWVRSEPWIGST